MTKSVWKSKTVWVAILQGVAGILTAVLVEAPELKAVGYLAMSKSVIDFALRVITRDKVRF